MKSRGFRTWSKTAFCRTDKAWSKIVVDWKKWKDDGVTEHRNWWPGVYRLACQRQGIEPDPELLAYGTTYEYARADLKDVAG